MNDSEWIRVNRSQPCVVCGKNDWCLIAEDESACICPRVEQGSKKYIEGSGFLHILRERPRDWKPVIRHIPKQTPKDMAPLAKRYYKLATGRLGALSSQLGVSIKSLERLRVGWTDLYSGSWSFPMRDHKYNIIGIRLRLEDGTKLSVRGGREGLFIPRMIGPSGSQIVICEGPSDTGALMDLHFYAIGRPNCQGGTEQILSLMKKANPRLIVILADADGPGRKGAKTLARKLDKYFVKVVEPPEGASDARDWKNQGATHSDIQEVIDFTKEGAHE